MLFKFSDLFIVRRITFYYKEVCAKNKQLVMNVDEVHSSQTDNVKRVLAETEKVLEECIEQAYEEEAKFKDD